MLCFIIELINIEFVGGAKRRATAISFENETNLKRIICACISIANLYMHGIYVYVEKTG
jgi:hypothetical protein